MKILSHYKNEIMLFSSKEENYLVSISHCLYGKIPRKIFQLSCAFMKQSQTCSSIFKEILSLVFTNPSFVFTEGY